MSSRELSMSREPSERAVSTGSGYTGLLECQLEGVVEDTTHQELLQACRSLDLDRIRSLDLDHPATSFAADSAARGKLRCGALSSSSGWTVNQVCVSPPLVRVEPSTMSAMLRRQHCRGPGPRHERASAAHSSSAAFRHALSRSL